MSLTRRGFLQLGVAGAMAASATALGGCAAGPAPSGQAASPATMPTPATPAATPATPTAAERILATMTAEQKVAQLFVVKPEGLTGVETATQAGTITQEALAKYPVGGMAYFGENIVGADQFRTMLSNTAAYSKAAGAGVPAFLSVDEEGGPEVARIANSGLFDVPAFPAMAQIGASGDVSQAVNVGTSIGSYLLQIGFNLDFAPDADVLTNPDNKVIGSRSFSSDADVCAEMVSAEVKAMAATGCLPCAKHFPGHGNTLGDSHEQAVTTDKSLDELRACEFLPFSAAIEAGVPLVMVGHISTPNATGDDLPASLSSTMMGDILRGELGFDGVIISDSFSMGAITGSYPSADAAVAFFRAGGDMLLMPDDFPAAYQGVLDAISAGTLSQDRIDESVLRILEAKAAAGLIV